MSWEPEGGWAVPAEPFTGGLPPTAPPSPPPPLQGAFVPHPPPSAPAGRALSIGPLSVVLAVVLTLACFAQVAATSAFAARTELIGDLRRINSLDQSILDRAIDVDQRIAAANAVIGLSWLVGGVLWIVWQRRFVRNASRFAPISPSLGWGSWGWLVPVAGVYLPPSQLANAARSTDPHQLLGRSGMAPPVLYVWWVLFGLANFAGLISQLTAGDAEAALRSGFTIGAAIEAIDRLERADLFATVSLWLTAAAALAAVATVLVCTDRQRKLLTALGVQN